ncbi:MAG: hypothetical protein MUF18_17400 [Fimbriiglobus sp.]|jgi:hypothetical protein|nr:hypothetical protein [Fimbriiglobus sp.]
MTRSLAVLLLVLGAGAALAQKSSSTGHVSDVGRYSVVFPAKPAKLDVDKPLATSAGNLTLYSSKVEASNVVYSVSFVDYPPSFKEVQPDRILDGVLDGLKGRDGQIMAQSKWTVANGDGREVTIQAGANVVRAKVCIVDRRLYLVQVCGKGSAVIAEKAEEFLSGFQLAK